MSLPDNRLLDIIELKQAIANSDLTLASGATAPPDECRCPDFDELDEWISLDTVKWVNDGFNMDQVPILGANIFIDYIINVLAVGATLDFSLANINTYGTSKDDKFGFAVSISGDRAIVGADGEDEAGYLQSGKAYIYNTTSGALLHTLDNPNDYSTPTGDNFGAAVSISGNYAIVGAYGEDNVTEISVGKAYIFNVTTGALVHTLDNPNPVGSANTDNYAMSVSISDTYALVSAYRENDEDGGSRSGKVYVYNISTGALVQTLDNPNPYGSSSDDYFGRSVSICGNNIIVGAYGEDDGGALAGKAYIFNASTGALTHTLDNPNPAAVDEFGSSVSIATDFCVVGSMLSGTNNSGNAYIFNNSTGALTYTLENPNAYGTVNDDQFGSCVSISDEFIIIGAIGEDDAAGTTSGKAYVFITSSGELLYTLDNPNTYGTSTDDYFANSLSISGSHAVVGAFGEDDASGTQSGKAYIYNMLVAPIVIQWLLNVTTASNSGNSYNYNAEPIGSCRSMDFGDDGKKLYMIEYNNTNKIYQFSLTTAYDITTISYDNTAVALQPLMSMTNSNIFDFDFSADGTTFIVAYHDYNIQKSGMAQFNLSVPWDISSISYHVKKTLTLEPKGVAFTGDGMSVVVADTGTGGNDHYVRRYNLGQAYNISTTTLINETTPVYTGSYCPVYQLSTLKFNTNGDKLYFINPSDYKIYEVTLTEGKYITSGSHLHSANGTFYGYSAAFNPDGTKMLMLDGGTKAIYEFT